MYKHMSIADAKAYLDKQGSGTNAQFIDIRDEMSFQQGHIPSSQHISHATLEDFIRDADTSKPLLVCCYHGNSSQQAAEFLSNRGFEDVYSIDGGFEAWKLEYDSEISD